MRTTHPGPMHAAGAGDGPMTVRSLQEGQATLELVPETVVAQLVDRALAYDAVRRAFVSVWRGESTLCPVLAGRGAAEDTKVNIKFGYDKASGALGLKVGTYWPTNQALGLPNHGATTLLLSPDTGFPAALVAASLLNRYRTAAANDVATDVLSRRDARRLAVIGTGRQAEYEVRAIAAVRRLSEVVIGARTQAHGEALRERLGDLGLPIHVRPVEEAVPSADIITTITTARAPLFDARLVRPGTHVSAMGADAVGKQELDPGLLRIADIFADAPLQSVVIGEGQHLGGADPAEHITAVGAVLADDRPGRRSEEAITVFDSSGLAAQDIEVASAVLARARERGLIQVVGF